MSKKKSRWMLPGATLLIGMSLLHSSIAQPSQGRPAKVNAASAHVTTALSSGVIVDWSAGELQVTTVGLADRRAPTPDIARPAAYARAQARARVLLRADLSKLPWADGKTVADHVTAAQLEEAVALATVTVATPQVDGGWQVSMMLPLEIVRQLARGPRAIAAGSSEPDGPEIIVDARALKLLPAIGITFSGAVGSDSGSGSDCAVRWERGVKLAKGAHDGADKRTLGSGALTAASVANGNLVVKSLAGMKPGSSCVVVIGAP